MAKGSRDQRDGITTRIGDIEANLPKVLPLYERAKPN